jgi:hypothetical protein
MVLALDMRRYHKPDSLEKLPESCALKYEGL